MKKVIQLLSAAILVAGFAAPVISAELNIADPVKLDKKGKVVIAGSGFSKGQAITLLFTTADGVVAEINYALEPAPVADDKGQWTTTWSYGRFVKKKLVDAGRFRIQATDEEFNELSAGMITFEK